jgi:hypothetical protein
MTPRWLITAFTLGADQLIQNRYGALGVCALVALGFGIKAGHAKSAAFGAVVLVLLMTQA